VRLYDAHNHLQDERFTDRAALIATCRSEHIAQMVVNGACEGDWPNVAELARTYPEVIPSFGYHPWYLHGRSPDWLENLKASLEAQPSAVGEFGLDRWKPGLSYEGQEDAFVAHLSIAAERNLPASIHCIQAWGRLFDLLRENPRPQCGVLLHSYGGSPEMVLPLAKLGAYFSFPGYYAQPRKAKHQETFKQVPLDRLLIETDAPDQHPPENLVRFPLLAADKKPLNHPANLRAIYEFVAELRGMGIEELAAQVEDNFRRLFGSVLSQG
jgi:TatD DNase family protein